MTILISLLISLLPFLLSTLIGYLLVSTLFVNKQSINKYRIFQLSMGFSLGSGITGLFTFFSILILGYTNRAAVITIDIFFALILYLIYRFYIRHRLTPDKTIIKPSSESSRHLLRLSLLFICVVAGLVFITRAIVNPFGEWDAIGVWNYHARYVYESGKDWKNLFKDNLQLSHHDYPWLLPSIILHGWMYTGDETIAVPIINAALFTFVTVILLYYIVRDFSNTNFAYLAILALFCNPNFMLYGASQMADILLSNFFLLATFLLFVLYSQQIALKRVAFLAGITCGMAFMTKNEGMLFLILFGILLSTFSIKRLEFIKALSIISMYILGALPFIIITQYIKIFYAPPSEFLEYSSFQGLLLRVTDIHRYFIVLRAFFLHSTFFSLLIINIPLIIFLIAFLSMKQKKRNLYNKAPLIALALSMLLGYCMIYIITPLDLMWHINYSIDRLIIQIWPVSISTGLLITTEKNL